MMSAWHKSVTSTISLVEWNRNGLFLATRFASGYAGSWKKARRLQNPDIIKKMTTQESVPESKPYKKTSHIYVCGFGSTGSLGMKKFYRADKESPSELTENEVSFSTFRRLSVISSSDKLHDIACGYGFTLIAAETNDSDHTLLGCGLNSHSQIGYHSMRPGFPLEIVATPSVVPVPTKSKIKRVACGRSHSILLNLEGQIFSMGNNSLGQCGRPIQENELYFGSKYVHTIKELPANVSQIECGQDHSFFLTEDGKLYACGWGADGQTGLGHYNNQSEPTQVKGDIEGVKLVKVSSHADTVLALDDQGNLFGWGNTEYAQFRVLANMECEQFNVPKHLTFKGIPGKIVDVAAGGTICAILNDRGQVFVWGFGILGLGPKVDQTSRPTLIPESLFGMNLYNPSVRVVKIYAGLSHFAAISNQGDLYTWGKNRGRALGLPHGNDQFFPMKANMDSAVVNKVALGVDHTCAIAEKLY